MCNFSVLFFFTNTSHRTKAKSKLKVSLFRFFLLASFYFPSLRSTITRFSFVFLKIKIKIILTFDLTLALTRQ